ncbi:MAG TPA: LpxD N-terminal domain-containing protein, partial [Bacteroidales bacterium]|nr:LpxD N-terminal domain-containing protein [Bacteroidales bacterium]
MLLEKNYQLKEIASWLNANYKGDPNQLITGINEIHKVNPGDLTFVDHPKYYKKALQSKASVIIINKEDVECPQGKSLIFSDDPFRDYVFLVKKFRPFIASSEAISSSAIIGEGTIIQPNVFVGNNVIIGKNCIIHANVSIYDYTLIGDNVIIHSNTTIGGDAFYYKRRPDGTYDKLESCGGVVIEDKVEIGCSCAIDKGVSANTVIGKGTKIDNHVQIGHDTEIGSNCLIGSHATIAGVSKLEDNVIVWGQVAINKDLVIGPGAVILACSAVDKSLKGGKTYFGVPVQEAR